ncbi:putative methyl transferase [hydrothermal vent metagenome]|uniref:Putative methyl transferase n=1 Tax=hydrothermal vent metagenome TaxID=652676 RepID=A0A3B1E1L2_9ZZZZ
MLENIVANQFSKYAQKYGQNNIIQQIISKALVRDIRNQPKRILELGCGSGQVYKNIDWEFDFYKAIDSSLEMCSLHPKHPNLKVECTSFDDDAFLKSIKNEKYDIAISSSALQWSKSLDKLILNLLKITKNINVVLFTSNTFKSIQSITKKRSPILSLYEIKDLFSKYTSCEFEVFNYRLEFENKKEMFHYIKNSGVSSSSSLLSYKDAKQLYKQYSLSYLEFEVVFVKTIKI